MDINKFKKIVIKVGSSILVDENRHIAFSYASSKKFKMTNPIKYFIFTIIEKINLLKLLSLKHHVLN